MAYFQRMFNLFKLDLIDLHFWLCACVGVEWTLFVVRYVLSD